jgi:hypothetical protein
VVFARAGPSGAENGTMLATQITLGRPSPSTLVALHRSQDIGAEPGAAFRTICEVEKWPVWLSFLRSAQRVDEGPLRLGSEVAIRGAIPGDVEELYEVDAFLEGHIVSLVGAYSVRRRIDFRVEGRGEHSKVVARLSYPAYGGFWGELLDRITARRRLESALGDSLIHLKGLVEFKNSNHEALADF